MPWSNIGTGPEAPSPTAHDSEAAATRGPSGVGRSRTHPGTETTRISKAHPQEHAPPATTPAGTAPLPRTGEIQAKPAPPREIPALEPRRCAGENTPSTDEEPKTPARACVGDRTGQVKLQPLRLRARLSRPERPTRHPRSRDTLPSSRPSTQQAHRPGPSGKTCEEVIRLTVAGTLNSVSLGHCSQEDPRRNQGELRTKQP